MIFHLPTSDLHNAKIIVLIVNATKEMEANPTPSVRPKSQREATCTLGQVNKGV
jgi:hypothetical protein